LTKNTVLVAVRDGELASAIRQSTEFANPGIRVLTAETGSEAHALLQRESVSLAVTILPVRTGFEYVAIASERFPAMPHIVASCTQPGELDDIAIGLMEMLEQHAEDAPIASLACLLLDALILQRRASGFLRAIPLLDAIRLIEADSCSVTLTLRQPETNAMAVLFFRGGRLLDAHTTESGGMEAVREALQWDNVHISISSGCRDVAARIDRYVSRLMEDVAEDALPAAAPVVRPPTLREILAAEVVDYEALMASVPASTENSGESTPMTPRKPGADRIQETMEFDLDALLQFTMAESGQSGAAPPISLPRLSASELLDMGFACFAQKDYAGAVRHWEEAERHDPGNRTLHYNLKLARARLAGESRPPAYSGQTGALG
jgi:hypothetical protein